MSYALNLAEDGRILSATFPQYAPEAPQAETLPDGNLSDYLYLDGAFVYSPQPPEYPAAPEDIVAGKIFAVGGDFFRATMPIPRGESVTRYNAEPVSIVDIVNALQEAQKGE